MLAYKIMNQITILLMLSLVLPITVGAKDISDNRSYYAYITEIHNGPEIWHKDQSNPYDLGRVYRVVFLFLESYKECLHCEGPL